MPAVRVKTGCAANFVAAPGCEWSADFLANKAMMLTFPGGVPDRQLALVARQ
jgi:hypothetical protein